MDPLYEALYGERDLPTSLLFRFFVLRVLPAPLAVFLKLNFALNELLVLARPVINTITGLAAQFYELILRHMWQALYPLSFVQSIYLQMRFHGPNSPL